MPKHITAEHKKLVDRIASFTKDAKLKAFITTLYHEAIYEELTLMKPEYFHQVAKESFELYKNRKQDTNIKFSDAPEHHAAVLQIINKDIPFLVDSVTEEIRSLGIDIEMIVHVSMMTNRDTKGDFIDFIGDTTSDAVLQFHFYSIESKKIISLMLERVKFVLKCVSQSVEDWGVMRDTMELCIRNLGVYSSVSDVNTKTEAISFMEWLINKHFIFLGVFEAKVIGDEVITIDESKVGIAKYIEIDSVSPIDKEHPKSRKAYKGNRPIIISKWSEKSPVHRAVHMDNIIAKKFNDEGQCIGSYNFIGLLTSNVYYQSVRNIPIIRKKVAIIIDKYGYSPTSHNSKELVSIIESLPRGELLQMEEDELYSMVTSIVSLSLKPCVKLFMQRAQSERFLTCIIFIPTASFSTEARQKIEEIFCRHLGATISKRYIEIGDSPLTRMQLIFKTEPYKLPSYDIVKIERDVVNVVNAWSDNLFERLKIKHEIKDAVARHKKYQNAFGINYTTSFAPAQAVHDIKVIESALEINSVMFKLYESSKDANKGLTQLKVYSINKELDLSSLLPIIENLGMYARNVVNFCVNVMHVGTKYNVYIHHFKMSLYSDETAINEEIKQNVEIALPKIWNKTIDDDFFNKLIVLAGIKWREVVMIRAYAKYLRQVAIPVSQEYIMESLIAHPKIAKKIIELFNLKFDPQFKCNEAQISVLAKDLRSMLTSVHDSAQDYVLRSYISLVLATKRTNFFQDDENGECKEWLSFKIASRELDCVPDPKPFVEIFVYSVRFEASHLRGGSVARGGLRWSDRKEDFRTEVLGLMKAQMTKNCVIVPVGSKGCFFVKTHTNNRESHLKEGVECYKMFLSGMLDITDNVIEGKIIHPQNVAIYDDDDPYLVVAADKGTATFSDYANGLSEDYNFWLGDAFASGGSAGYDHKKLGITARGAWVCVVQHFAEMGVDIDKETFTAIGVGDMQGDVFGNGVLLSKNMKLIAAFNHLHIFIDPAPDPKISYKERSRLFNKHGTQWSDYNPSLISKGGGVFSRGAKEIKITKEMHQALGISMDVSSCTPSELMNFILKSPVDLLWNGGIGTFVKAKTENHEAIKDKANDLIRVDGSQLGCKIIGEGGNLGMTQLGRVEYAQSGGRINTDFIDNAAGVNCSDHEVNLKIAFSDALRSGKISLEARNNLLDKMSDEVCEHVLRDNAKQGHIISIESEYASSKINDHVWLIRHLESRGELKRKIEYIPSTEEIRARISAGGGMTRPEISVLVSYAKNSIYSMLVQYDFTKNPPLKSILYSYFPSDFIKKHKDLIDGHKLKNEILATLITNDMVNKLGSVFFHQILDEGGLHVYDVAIAFIISKEIFDIDASWAEAEALKGLVRHDIYFGLFQELQTITKRSIAWLLRYHKNLDDIEVISQRYKKHIPLLSANFTSIISHNMKLDFERTMIFYEGSKKLTDTAKKIVKTRMLSQCCDITEIADKMNKDMKEVALLFFRTGQKMSFDWMFKQFKKFEAKQYFQTIALKSLVNEIEDLQSSLTIKVLKTPDCDSIQKDYGLCIKSLEKIKNYEAFVSDLQSHDTSHALVSMLIMAIKRAKEFL